MQMLLQLFKEHYFDLTLKMLSFQRKHAVKYSEGIINAS